MNLDVDSLQLKLARSLDLVQRKTKDFVRRLQKLAIVFT